MLILANMYFGLTEINHLNTFNEFINYVLSREAILYILQVQFILHRLWVEKIELTYLVEKIKIIFTDIQDYTKKATLSTL